MRPFPRLNNYLQSVTEKEVKEYLVKLLDWCDSAEHILMGLEIIPKKCGMNLHCADCGENVWCFSDETLAIIQSLNSKESHDGRGVSERAQTRKSLNCRNDETPITQSVGKNTMESKQK